MTITGTERAWTFFENRLKARSTASFDGARTISSCVACRSEGMPRELALTRHFLAQSSASPARGDGVVKYNIVIRRPADYPALAAFYGRGDGLG